MRQGLGRREFVQAGAMAAGTVALGGCGLFAERDVYSPAQWKQVAHLALAALAGNVRMVPGFDGGLVLIEGSSYQGIWQECGPHEALVYATLAKYVAPRADGVAPLDVARNAHRAFFQLQESDGQLPDAIVTTGIGYSQLQMVTPIAATAWEVSQMARDEAFLAEAYAACSRWDAWLRQYRNTRGTGLVEAFCMYDTGQDNSPRWAGIQGRCLDGDAAKCPPAPGMPRLCPDLSASVYGARVALAAMAAALGKRDEAERWLEDARTIQKLIVAKLYDPQDASFYDVDTNGEFVRVRSVANLRVLQEHVLDLGEPRHKEIFKAVWERQLHNPMAYWTPWPFPSIAVNDPLFVRPIPSNSWGGASQALTALRTLRWMDYYGKSAEQKRVMQQWTEAMLRQRVFCQQIDPMTGVFTMPDPGGYSPAALVFLAFAQGLGKI